jgi:SHS2 domain-containing protein
LDRGFSFHEHTADITIECWAPTMEEAFVEAARATFEVILDTSTVDPVQCVEVEVTGLDLKELLVEWIGRLIALVDINGQFYSKFDVDEIAHHDSSYTLSGHVWGEDFDLDKHDTRTEVKAMTYADMSIDQSEEKTTIWFTLDL